MNPKKYGIFQIQIVRQSIQRSIMELENIWTKSAVENMALDCEAVLNCSKQIKEETISILNICHAQPEHWNESRKRVLNEVTAPTSPKNLRVR